MRASCRCGAWSASLSPPAAPPATRPAANPARAEERSCDGAGEGALGGALADDVSLVVQVEVAARERAAHHDPVVPVVLDERDLVDPGRVVRGADHVGVRAFGALDVVEDHQSEVEAHGRTLGARAGGRILPTG